MKRKIKYVGYAMKWFDKVSRNTYHTIRITRCSDAKVIAVAFQRGHGDQYRRSGLELMAKEKWIPKPYRDRYPSGDSRLMDYERENNYPIMWIVQHGTKKECIAHQEL